jgi:hypothetical protein
MSFKVIDGDGPGKEERERERDREFAEHEFSWAIRDTAANMFRIVRGAGKPYELLLQMKKAIDSAIKFRDAHGHWPSSDFIQRELALHDEYEHQLDRQAKGKASPEAIELLRKENYLERLSAVHTICRGALQIAASGLIGQDTQQRAGESELHEGLRQIERIREERIRKAQEDARAARLTPVTRKPRKPARRKPSEPNKL